jgi:glycosyltransferase involved in cell wall biosynthesis
MEPGTENDPEAHKAAAEHGMQIVQNPQNGKWYLYKVQRGPQENAKACMRAAKLVTVSTPRLAEVYKDTNKNIVVIPNAIDPEIWPENAKSTDGFIRLGLFGSNTHYNDWREIVDVLKGILDEFPNVRLVFNCWWVAKSKQGDSMAEQEKTPQFPDFFSKAGLIEHPQVEWAEPSEIDDYPAWLAAKAIDIGLAPLKDCAFNRGKSGIKYLEWGVLGVPGVYADLDPYNMVQHGVTGFKCGKASEWTSKLRQLIKDKDLRERMGAAARADVLTNHTAEASAKKMADAITKMMEEK